MPNTSYSIPKKIIKKIQKIKKHHSSFIYCQIEPGQAEKEKKKKKFPSTVSTWPGLKAFQKKFQKEIVKKKCHSSFISSQTELKQVEKGGEKKQKQNFVLGIVSARPDRDGMKKRKKKNLFQVSFLPNTGRSNPKKNQKITKHHSRFISNQIGKWQAEKEKKKKKSFIPSTVSTQPIL